MLTHTHQKKPQFKETEDEKIVSIIKRYYDQGTWKDNTVFEEASFDLLQDILLEAGVIDGKVPYADLVTTDYSNKAIER